MYDLGVPIIQIGAKKLCVWVHSRHKIIRMSSVTWVRTLSMCALTAQRSIGTIPRWRLTKHCQRNVNFTAFSDDKDLRELGRRYPAPFDCYRVPDTSILFFRTLAVDRRILCTDGISFLQRRKRAADYLLPISRPIHHESRRGWRVLRGRW